MDTPSISQQNMLTNVSGLSTLISLLQHGADYLRQGHYMEAEGFLVLARERLGRNQSYFTEVLDAFIQANINYNSIQNALRETITQSVKTCEDLQHCASLLEQALQVFIQNSEALRPPTILIEDRKSFITSSTKLLASQNQQDSLALTIPNPVEKSVISLPEVYITCFGRFEIKCAGKPVMLCSNRAGQSILRYLIAKSGHSETGDKLKDLFWPEDEPEAAQRKLHHAISALRYCLNRSSSKKVESNHIVYKNGIYALNTAALGLHTDVDDFLSFYHTGQQKSEERAALYEKACYLYTGPFLTEDIYSDWSTFQREQLSRIYVAMCRALIEHYLRLKCYEDASQWAAKILKENPCDETAHQQLIQIYTAQGHRSAAIQQYQLCERTLREELGIVPSRETTATLQKCITPCME